VTKKRDLIALIRAMRTSVKADDDCWSMADDVLQEWDQEHRKKVSPIMEEE
jgi:hypothetical protein